ncbi:phage terminase small subunit [Hydrogenophaga electricum]|uniref:Bacteriophage terminase endonuclease subunit n=1 Tax=Hydrogenophaga electricum TaxID=1230953 RepID=A0ABQ6C4C5_9BURK|nr:phage terminase small subunit [Hydrogenophaga electricum]GLS13585.1 bacteriophage terminase endonuclease subunit [Hydrogenophaga electricum]
MGYMERHFRRVQAAKQAATAAAPQATAAEVEGRTQYERMLLLLDTHQQQLRNLQSMEARAEHKAKLLPEYDAYLSGLIAAGTSPQDDVLVTLMLWHFDCALIARALDLAAVALGNNMVMPQQHKRTLPTVVVEETADLMLAGKGIETPLQALEFGAYAGKIVGDADMPDQVRAKLCKAMGRASVAAEISPDETLQVFKRALELDKNAGVKKDIEQLERAIKNAAKQAEAGEEGAG